MAATTAAVVGIASAVAGAGMSFSEASKQRKAATTARIEADKAIQEARRRAEENTYKSLSLSKDPYQRAREAALVTGAQAIEAGAESERGVAATAGRVQMAENEMQRDIANEQTQQIQELNKVVADEDARLKDYAAKVSMAEAEGAQLAMRDAEQRRAANVAQGFQQVGNLAASVGQALPLYYEGKGGRQYNKLVDQATAAGVTQEQLQNQLAGLASTNPQFASLSGVGYSANSVDANGNPIANAMTPLQFQDYLSSNPALIKSLLKQNIFAPQAQTQSAPFLPTGEAGVSYKDVSPDMMNPFNIYGGI